MKNLVLRVHWWTLRDFLVKGLSSSDQDQIAGLTSTGFDFLHPKKKNDFDLPLRNMVQTYILRQKSPEPSAFRTQNCSNSPPTRRAPDIDPVSSFEWHLVNRECFLFLFTRQESNGGRGIPPIEYI